jgi:hypothetical protein
MNSGIPPLAGLCSHEQASRPGRSVDETVRLLRRLARIERRTSLVMAAHLNAVPEWEVKCALSLHLWQDAEHCAVMRDRVAELRKPPHYLDRPDDAALETFFEELLRSGSTRELLTGVYQVLKPRLVDAIRDHRARANPLADQPTLRLVRLVLAEEEEQVEWGTVALAALGGPDETWGRHLAAYLDAAGGVAGDGDRGAALPPPRADRPFEPVRVPRRDERFTRLWDSRGRGFFDDDQERPAEEVNWRLLYVRLTEMHVPELLALTLYEWPDASFEVHRDLARHLWDEARHAMFGEVYFEAHGVDWCAVPHELSFASYPNTRLEPRERYALLYGVEHGAMRKDGKRAQHEAAQASGAPLPTLFQDFDWADEVLHVHIGRRVLNRAYDTPAKVDEAAARTRAEYDAIVAADRALPRSDWWERFYASVASGA